MCHHLETDTIIMIYNKYVKEQCLGPVFKIV